MKIIRYTKAFLAWLEGLDTSVSTRIALRLDRAADGHYGDHKRFEGLIEIRLHFGSGYRLYCVEKGKEVIFVLAGGDKSTQNKDIKMAKKMKDML